MQFNYNQYLPIQSSAYLNNNNLSVQKTQTDVTPINKRGLSGPYGISIPEEKDFLKDTRQFQSFLQFPNSNVVLIAILD